MEVLLTSNVWDKRKQCCIRIARLLDVGSCDLHLLLILPMLQ